MCYFLLAGLGDHGINFLGASNFQKIYIFWENIPSNDAHKEWHYNLTVKIFYEKSYSVWESIIRFHLMSDLPSLKPNSNRFYINSYHFLRAQSIIDYWKQSREEASVERWVTVDIIDASGLPVAHCTKYQLEKFLK